MHRSFIEGTLRDMEGNAVLARATGRTDRNKLKIEEAKWFRYPDQLDEMVAYAEAPAKGDRRNVYLSPIIYGEERNGQGEISRSITNALWSQTIYLDSDSCPPDAFRLPPSRHVQTSRNHGHDYWFLTEPIPAHEAADIAHRITTAHKEQGSDPTGWSANKYLRMPTVNTSYDIAKPYEIKVHETGELYNPLDILGAYEDIEVIDRPTLEILANVPEVKDLPDFMDLASKIPSTEKRLNDLIYKTPKAGPDGWRNEQRYGLILDSIRFGFEDDEVASIVWHAPAGAKWHGDARGIAGVYGEIAKARKEIEFEQGRGDDQPVVEEPPKTEGKPVRILTKSERAAVAQRRNFVTDYMEWTKGKVQVFNHNYHLVNAIHILSLAFGAAGGIPKEKGLMPCNVYSFTLGGSSSGKSEADDVMWSVIVKLNPHDNPDIGGNHSENALIEMLLERDGKVSMMHEDEADGLIRKWVEGGWTGGVMSAVTRIYDGKVPMLGRVGKKELRVHDARAIMNMKFMGTPTAMYQVLTADMFKTGFLARPIWAIGEDIPATKESLKTKQVVGNMAQAYDSMPKYWANRFNRAIVNITADPSTGYDSRIPIHLSNEAMDRFDKAKWDILKHFEKAGEEDIFKTALRRMSDTIWKVSALLAMSEGRRVITLNDMNTTLSYAEVWLDSLANVVHYINGSAFSKACDEIEKFIMGREGKEAEMSAIFSARRAEAPRVTEEYLGALLKQKRIIERPTKAGGPRYYKIRERKEA